MKTQILLSISLAVATSALVSLQSYAESSTSFKEPVKDLPADPACRAKSDGEVLEYRTLTKKSGAELVLTGKHFGVFSWRSVEMLEVVYCTPGIRKKLVPASGAVFVPFTAWGISKEKLPLMSYQHGTRTTKEGGATAPDSLETNFMMAISSGLKSILVAPDYLGLGKSEGAHPYLHAASEASASRSLLLAARNLQENVGFKLNNDLYIFGYSQGGHATMALQRSLETDGGHGFNLKASAPMAGPFDLSTTNINPNSAPYTRKGAFYFLYMLNGLQTAYNLFGDYSEWIRPQYIESVMSLFQEATAEDEDYIARLPESYEEFFTEEGLNRLVTADKTHPINQAFAHNSLVNWAPKAATLLVHSGEDKLVGFQNSVTAKKNMDQLGAKAVHLCEVTGDHLLAFAYAVPVAIKWMKKVMQAPASLEPAEKLRLLNQKGCQ